MKKHAEQLEDLRASIRAMGERQPIEDYTREWPLGFPTTEIRAGAEARVETLVIDGIFFPRRLVIPSDIVNKIDLLDILLMRSDKSEKSAVKKTYRGESLPLAAKAFSEVSENSPRLDDDLNFDVGPVMVGERIVLVVRAKTDVEFNAALIGALLDRTEGAKTMEATTALEREVFGTAAKQVPQRPDYDQKPIEEGFEEDGFIGLSERFTDNGVGRTGLGLLRLMAQPQCAMRVERVVIEADDYKGLYVVDVKVGKNSVLPSLHSFAASHLRKGNRRRVAQDTAQVSQLVSVHLEVFRGKPISERKIRAEVYGSVLSTKDIVDLSDRVKIESKGIRRIEDEPALRLKDSLLAFYAEGVAPCKTRVSSMPQVPFRPGRIEVAEECSKDFKILFAKIGDETFDLRHLPREAFLRGDHEQPVFATAQVSQSVVLAIENITDSPKPFSAVMWGKAIG